MSIYQGNKMISGRGNDGFSPVVEILAADNGHTLRVVDATGTHDMAVANGADGYSPTLTITETASGCVVNITDKNGNNSFQMTKRYNVTLTASGWTAGSGYAFEQTVSVSGMTANTDFDYCYSISGTDAEADAAIANAASLINYASGGAGGVVFRCATTKPAVDIPVYIRVYG